MINTITQLDDASARLNQSLDHELIGLLDSICQELEITEAMFTLAEERYMSIAEYLGGNGSPLAIYKPVIHPQGSINTGTTVKPPQSCEFDVDVICQLAISERAPQQAFLELVYNRLAQRGIYRLKRMNRCVRVQYENEFHIDITPGIPDIDQGPENILVTDKEQGKWKESNPKDYCKWFKAVGRLQPALMYEVLANERLSIKAAQAEPLPAPQFSKPVLNRVVQLLKRHRDLIYEGDKDAPISAIIATLAGSSYQYHARHGRFTSRVEFLKAVVTDMPQFTTRVNGDELVPNPRNPLENYADKWQTRPHRRRIFHEWHAQAVTHFEALLDSIGKGRQALFESLSNAYGDSVVKAASTRQAQARKILSEDRAIGVTRNTGIIAPIVGPYALGQSVVPVKKHTNFGS